MRPGAAASTADAVLTSLLLPEIRWTKAGRPRTWTSVVDPPREGPIAWSFAPYG